MNSIKTISKYAGRVAAPFLLAGAVAVLAASCTKSLPPTPASTPTNQQRVENVLSIAKQRIGECYDNAYQFWQAGQGTIECRSALDNMFSEIDKIAAVGFEGDLRGDAEKLKGYLGRNGVFLDFAQLTSRGQVIPNFFIARVNREAKEKLKLADGEAEIDVAYIDAPTVGNFPEEKLSTSDARIVVGELRRDGKVYVRTDDALFAAGDLWGLYERPDYRGIINNAKSQMQLHLSQGEVGKFYDDLQVVLQLQEGEDLHVAAKKSGKGKDEFVRLFMAANLERRKFHGARHDVDIRNNKGYSGAELERRAKLEELLAPFPAETMHQGYDTLGSVVYWVVSPLTDYKKAGEEVANCFLGTIDKNRTYFPQIKHNDSLGARERGLETMQQFPLLTGTQIHETARACWEALYGPVVKTSRNNSNSYPRTSNATVWSRNEARFSRDLRSKAKAY